MFAEFSRFLLAAISSGLILLGAGASDKCSHSKPVIKQQETIVTKIYAEADWYRERPEPEKEWRGVLRKREVPAGPAARTALSYKLVADDEEIAVYAANAEEKLAAFEGRQVLISGKLVDLSKEGFGQELWIATIQTRERESK